MRPSGNPLLVEALAIEIKARRIQLEMSQEDLAGACEIDRPYISLIEVGRKQPTLSVLLLLAEGLDMPLAGLIKRVEARYAKMKEVNQKSKPAKKTA
jgi:transcriptional regulator with XRE-family HTH domain